MQEREWQTDKQTDKQTITLAGRFHFTSAASFIAVSPPPRHRKRNIRLFVRDISGIVLRCFVLIPNPRYHILCVIDPSFVHRTSDRSLFLESACFLHSFGFQSCSHASPPVLPTLPRELARALSQSAPTNQSIACPIAPRASFLYYVNSVLAGVLSPRTLATSKTYLASWKYSPLSFFTSWDAFRVLRSHRLHDRHEGKTVNKPWRQVQYQLPHTHGVSGKSHDISLGSRLASSRVVLSVLWRGIHRMAW